MRTTITLDADLYDFISAYARGKGITKSAAVSELIRRAEQMPEPASGRLKVSKSGYYIIAAGDVLTMDRVKELSEDEVT